MYVVQIWDIFTMFSKKRKKNTTVDDINIDLALLWRTCWKSIQAVQYPPTHLYYMCCSIVLLPRVMRNEKSPSSTFFLHVFLSVFFPPKKLSFLSLCETTRIHKHSQTDTFETFTHENLHIPTLPHSSLM